MKVFCKQDAGGDNGIGLRMSMEKDSVLVDVSWVSSYDMLCWASHTKEIHSHKRTSCFNLPFRRRFGEDLHVSVAERVGESPPRSSGLSPMQKYNIKVVSMAYYVRFALPPISCHGRRERPPRTLTWVLGAVCLMSLLRRAVLIARSWGTSWTGWALHLVQMVRGSGIWTMSLPPHLPLVHGI